MRNNYFKNATFLNDFLFKDGGQNMSKPIDFPENTCPLQGYGVCVWGVRNLWVQGSEQAIAGDTHTHTIHTYAKFGNFN